MRYDSLRRAGAERHWGNGVVSGPRARTRYRARRWRSRRRGSTGSSSAASSSSRVRRGARPDRAGDRRAAGARRDRGRGGRRPRGRGGARARSTATGGRRPPTERSRLLHALADAIVANRKELAELEARNVGKAISSVKAELGQAVENFRFYASAVASIARSPNPLGGSLLFYSLKEPVGVVRADRALELPADDGDVEARAGAGGGLHGRAQAGPGDAADRAAAGRARRRGRVPAGRRQRRPRRRADDGRVPRPASRRRQGRVHRLDGDGRRDHAALRRSRSSG